MRRAIIVALLLGSVAPSSVAAQYEEARAEFEEAEHQFRSGNYALALQGFQRTYAMMEGHPNRALVLFNVGRCQEELGQLREARDTYARYLREAAGDAVNRQQVEDRLRELETRLQMEGQSESPSQSAEPPQSDGRQSVSPADDGAESGNDLMVGGIVGLVVGGLGLATYGIFGALSLGEYAGLEDGCGATASCSDGDVEALRALSLVADVGLGIGIAGVAVGTLLVLLGVTSRDSDESVAVVPLVDRSTQGLALVGAFQ